MNALSMSLLTFVSTGAGGLLAFRFRDRLHLVLGFTAGVLLGVVAFELLPEIFERSQELGRDPTSAMVALVAGFLLFHGIEKFLLVHQVHEPAYAHHHHPHVGLASALALVGHSTMDGVGIGLAFQASPALGMAVAIAVIAHDFCDGLNTVGLMLAHHNSNRLTIAMLLLDSLAPVLGAAATLAFAVTPGVLVSYLGFFAGFLLYIGASDILPEAHSRAPTGSWLALLALTASGTGLGYAVARFAG